MYKRQRPKFGNLQNLKVLNAGAVIAAPFVCELFAEQGADVIELESTVAPDMYRIDVYKRQRPRGWRRRLRRRWRSPMRSCCPSLFQFP